ncbi:MAG TPA: hypothetical protein VK154_08600, partial [Chitinophagales bacterium]|nr:hypothetical protein [Chitinophagales bacterium]
MKSALRFVVSSIMGAARGLLCVLCMAAAAGSTAQLPSAGLVAYYPFNNSSADESGNKNDGQINGAIAPAT